MSKEDAEGGAASAEEEEHEPGANLTPAENFKMVMRVLFLEVPPYIVVCHVFLPMAIALRMTFTEDSRNAQLALFVTSLLALIPLAERLGYVTECMATRTSEAIAGLLNASFGNVPELVTLICAVREGEASVAVQALIGGSLSAILLVSGLSALFGGIRNKLQNYNRNLANTLLVVSLFIAVCVGLATFGYQLNPPTDQHDWTILGGSRVLAFVAIGLYGGFLLFSLITHKDLCETDGDDEDDPSEIGIWTGVSIMAVLIAIISYLSDALVLSVNGAAVSTGMPHHFICAVIIPNVNNALEHAVAIMMAWRNKVDASIATSVGSGAQLSALLLPFAILYSWMNGGTISFAMGDALLAVNLIIGVIFCMLVLSTGQTTWLHGFALCACYFAIGVSYFFIDINDGVDEFSSFLNHTSPSPPPGDASHSHMLNRYQQHLQHVADGMNSASSWIQLQTGGAGGAAGGGPLMP